MRIALISDIHGNLVSLDAVLTDIDRQRVNEIICLGDVATLGPQPGEVIQRLQALGCPSIQGNHESYLFDIDLARAYMNADWFIDSLNWCRERLSDADLSFLHSFEPLLKFKIGDHTKLLCYHGSPRSNAENIFATTSPEKLDAILRGKEAAVMAGGHTHVQMVRQHNGTLIVNAGSVGMPFEQMPFKNTPRVLPWAEYTILSWDAGSLGVELRRVPIDMQKVKRVALESEMPETSDWIKNWITLGMTTKLHTGPL